jgi:hypothetical protein
MSNELWIANCQGEIRIVPLINGKPEAIKQDAEKVIRATVQEGQTVASAIIVFCADDSRVQIRGTKF